MWWISPPFPGALLNNIRLIYLHTFRQRVRGDAYLIFQLFWNVYSQYAIFSSENSSISQHIKFYSRIVDGLKIHFYSIVLLLVEREESILSLWKSEQSFLNAAILSIQYSCVVRGVKFFQHFYSGNFSTHFPARLPAVTNSIYRDCPIISFLVYPKDSCQLSCVKE